MMIMAHHSHRNGSIYSFNCFNLERFFYLHCSYHSYQITTTYGKSAWQCFMLVYFRINFTFISGTWHHI